VQVLAARSSGMDAVLVAAEEAAAPATMRHVDRTDVICPRGRCQVVTRAGQIMYRDQHHLTAGYSATLWRSLSERLEPRGTGRPAARRTVAVPDDAGPSSAAASSRRQAGQRRWQGRGR
jgi:SGNH domain (fused to AT3 domains)